MLEKIENDIKLSSEVLASMPLTTDKNKKLFLESVSKEIDKFKKIQDSVFIELKKRCEPYENLKFNDYSDVKDNLNDFSKALAWSTDLNAPYEKLKIDKVIYDLSIYESKEDSLNFINKNILKVIKIFEIAGIKLTSNDFNYTVSVHQYMEVFFKYQYNLSDENLKKAFNDTFWESPNLVLELSLNIRYLYLKNKKIFERYTKNFNSNLLSRFDKGAESIVNDYSYLRKKVNYCLDNDRNNLLYDFYNENLNIDDYSPEKIETIISNLFGDVKEDVVLDLISSLEEYNGYKRYEGLINDIRKLYQEELEKDFLNKRLKQISKLEGKLFGYVKKSSRRSTLTKVDKYEPLIDQTVSDIKAIYDEIDSNILKVKIKENLKDNSTIFKALLLVCRHYGILANYFKDVEDVDKEINDLIDFTLNPQNKVITNLTILEEADIVSIIVSNYRMLNVNIDNSSLDDTSSIMNDLFKIKTYFRLKKLKIDILDMQNVKQAKLVVSKFENK